MSRPKAYSYVRFSSKRQEKGSSVERQVAATKEFAIRHGLDLQDVTYSDLGVSAFRGKHARTGALRAFVDAVIDEKIDKGSWLLVESLDRISREQLADAQQRLSSLLSLGITVATMSDGQIFTPSSRNNLGDAIQILVSLSRSHEESMMKSQRSKGGWKKTRRIAEDDKTHPKSKGGILPGWLRKNEDGEIEVVEKNAKTVRQIYSFALDGLGSIAISNKLNESGIPSFTGKKWSAGSISKILTRRYVLGEWQPHTTSITEEGKRKLTPSGDPLHIYPQIIEEADWLKIQQMRNKRDTLTGRAASDQLRNVFSGLARCVCGAPIRFTKRANKKAALVCRTVEYGQHCEHRKQLQYAPFKAICLTALSSIDYSTAFPGSRSQLTQKTENKRNQLLVVEEKLTAFLKRKEKAVETLLDNSDPLLDSALRDALTGIESAVIDHRQQADQLTAELGELNIAIQQSTEHAVSLQNVADLMLEDGGNERINQLLKTQVTSLRISATEGTIEAVLRHTGDKLKVDFDMSARAWKTYRLSTKAPELLQEGFIGVKNA